MSTTEPTDEMVEAAARSMWELRRRPTDPEWGSDLDLGVREEYRKDARAALRAALAVAPAPSADDREALAAALDRLNAASIPIGMTEAQFNDAMIRDVRRILTDARRSPVSPSEDLCPSCRANNHAHEAPGACPRCSCPVRVHFPVSPPEDVAELIAEATERYTNRQQYEEGTITRRIADARSADDVPRLIAALRTPVPVSPPEVANAIEAVQRLAQFVIDEMPDDSHGAINEDLDAVERVLRSAFGAPVPVETRKPRELVCDDCGRDYPVWFAPNDVWNLGGGERGGFECPSCFAIKYEAWAGWPVRWSFAPDVALRVRLTREEER